MLSQNIKPGINKIIIVIKMQVKFRKNYMSFSNSKKKQEYSNYTDIYVQEYPN